MYDSFIFEIQVEELTGYAQYEAYENFNMEADDE